MEKNKALVADDLAESVFRFIFLQGMFLLFAAISAATGNWLLAFAVDWTYFQWLLASGWFMAIIHAAIKYGHLEDRVDKRR